MLKAYHENRHMRIPSIRLARKMHQGLLWINCSFILIALINSYFDLHSEEGLTLETSAFLIFHSGYSTFINSFDKTKFLYMHSVHIFFETVKTKKFQIH